MTPWPRPLLIGLFLSGAFLFLYFRPYPCICEGQTYEGNTHPVRNGICPIGYSITTYESYGLSLEDYPDWNSGTYVKTVAVPSGCSSGTTELFRNIQKTLELSLPPVTLKMMSSFTGISSAISWGSFWISSIPALAHAAVALVLTGLLLLFRKKHLVVASGLFFMSMGVLVALPLDPHYGIGVFMLAGVGLVLLALRDPA